MGKFLRSFPVSAGHVTGAGTSDEVGSADMDPTGVTPGSYTSADITVDAAGRVTAVANGSGGAVADGDYGDITVSSSGAAWAIDAGAVSLSKLAAGPAYSVLGAVTAGARADVEADNGSMDPSVLVFDSTSELRFLSGPPAAPWLALFDDGPGMWVAAGIGAGLAVVGGDLTATGTGGTVTSVDVSSGASGFGFAGGPVTGSGTITFDVTDPALACATLQAANRGLIVASGLTSSTARLVGRTTAGTGAVEEIAVGTGLSLSGGSLACTVSPGTGTVTSVNLTPPAAGLTVSGGPVTTSGSITLALADDLAALEALTGTNTIYYRSAASTWTPVTIGTALGFSAGTLAVTDAELAAIAGLTSAADAAPYFTGSGTAALMTVTAAARSVLDDTTVGAMLATLGGQPLDATLTAFAALTVGANSLTIGTGADAFSQTSFAANTFPARASTGNLVAKTITDFGLSLVDDADATAGRSTLGLGTSAVIDTGTSGTKVALTDGANQWSAAQRFLNSSGIKILDTDASHTLGIVVGSNLTADRTLTLTTGDANRTVTLSGDTTLSGTNTGDQTITLTGDVTGSGTGSFAAAIGANKVTDAMLRQSAGLSVPGRSASTTGNVADITAANDGEVLRRSGATLGFGTVATAGIADDAVTYAKLQNVSATDRLLGRDTAGAGNAEELTVGGGIEFTGSGGIQRSALTGDVTASAGSNSTTVVSASDTAAGKIEIAVQSEMETGTDTARAVTPGRQHYHPSAAKAWVTFTVSGTTVTVQASYNVTSVTRTGAGLFTINFTSAFSGANAYAMVGTASLDTSAATLGGVIYAGTTPAPAAGSCDIAVGNFATGVAIDPKRCSVVFFGDQ